MATEQVAPVSPRGALGRLATASFLAYTSYALCRTPLLPLLARGLGAGPSLIGLVMGASTLTGVFVKLPAGALSDLLGRRRLLLTGAVIFAALPFTYLAVSTLTVLVLLLFAHGSATAIFGPVAAASLLRHCTGRKRGAGSHVLGAQRRTGAGSVLAVYLIAVDGSITRLQSPAHRSRGTVIVSGGAIRCRSLRARETGAGIQARDR